MATSYTVGKHYEDFIKSLVDSGRYATASEVMRDGLRLIEEREEFRQAKLEALKVEIQRGLNSGWVEDEFDAEEIKRRGRARMRAHAE